MSKIQKIKRLLSNVISFIILIISCIIICVAYYIAKYLKEISVYEILFHLNSDMSGTGTSIITGSIKACIFIFIILFLIIYIPITNSKTKRIVLKTKKNEKELKIYPNIFSKFKITYSIIILFISVLLIGSTLNFKEYVVNVNKSSDIYDNYYVDTNKVKLTFPKEKKNLILIYLESMESTLASKENGGAYDNSRIPELENLALDNINFSNTKLLGGGYNLSLTAWTIAATAATTSGTPLIFEIGNDYDKVESFMPNVKTLGDILKKENYNLELIQGSDKKFAGVDKYFTTHGNYKIFDYYTAIDKDYIDEDYSVWWGFEDKKLFEYSKTEITELSKLKNPFAVSIFTMDTHFKDGYLDKSCEEPFSDQMSNVFACSSKMVNEFVSWVKEQDFYENTTIVILGDHLSMQGEYFNSIDNYNRTIYNTFINSSVKAKKAKNREFSSLDMYPTILASMGVKIEEDKLGFGVNLFSKEKTMIEELGKDKFNTELLKKSKYYNENIQKIPGFDTEEEQNTEETTNEE